MMVTMVMMMMMMMMMIVKKNHLIERGSAGSHDPSRACVPPVCMNMNNNKILVMRTPLVRAMPCESCC